MKTSVILFAFLLASVAFADSKAKAGPTPPAHTPPAPAPEFCRVLDKTHDFVRCETVEVVCYSLKGNLACWPKANQAAVKQEPAVPAKK